MRNLKNSRAAFGREDGVVWWIRFRDVLREGKLMMVEEYRTSKRAERIMDEKFYPERAQGSQYLSQ